MARKRIDKKNVIIGILAALVVLEALFIFFYKPKVVIVKKETVAEKEKKEAKETQKEKGLKEAKEEKPVIPSIVVPKKAVTARIAVIVDDCGYNLQPCQYASRMEAPVTFSVLPDLPHSTEVAECIHRHNKEVMLHLPMEPHHNLDKYPEGYLIKTSMNRAKIESIINRALESVPHTVGVNNHMGSKATENTKVMTITFESLKKRGLFFVDSLVTSNSVCQKLARSLKVPFTKRDVFLDNINEREDIENQFAKLVAEAKKYGSAIGIGHARGLTLQIIAEQIKALESEGIAFVTIKDLAD